MAVGHDQESALKNGQQLETEKQSAVQLHRAEVSVDNAPTTSPGDRLKHDYSRAQKQQVSEST